jgi:hypothetical protein
LLQRSIWLRFDNIQPASVLQIKVPRDQEHFLDGLKRAGLNLPGS